VTRLALESGLDPVIIVTGYKNLEITQEVDQLAVIIVHNPEWQRGQGSSIKTGMTALPGDVTACFFLMCDQPLIKKEQIEMIIQTFLKKDAVIVVPRHGGRPGNPALFDRVTFDELKNLPDGSGGKKLFEQYPVTYMESPDDTILFDIDTEQDYQRLKERRK
jgi:molybdenum cofactor cytidylyltransferase